MSRYDTTPTDDERAIAREQLAADFNIGQRYDAGREYRRAGALGRLSAAVEGLTEVDDPIHARIIARARAIASAYQDTT